MRISKQGDVEDDLENLDWQKVRVRRMIVRAKKSK